MKRMKTAGTMLAAAAAVLLFSCDKNYDGPSNEKPKPDAPEEPVSTTVTSIYDLNQEEGYLNSHHTDWKSSSLEMDFRSYSKFASPQLMAKLANYPRLKKLANGTYMLTYQQNSAAHDVYYGLSNTMSSWDFKTKQLFEKVDFKEIDPAVPDASVARILYSSADFVVLKNGDILAFAAYRHHPDFSLFPEYNGIMMRKSTDNGKTWSAPERILKGVACWEPSALELSDGEIHVYYTRSNPLVGDSGTALLRSNDGGKSWVDVGYVVRQSAGVGTDGTTPIYTDQMPVAVQLNESGTIAVAVESRFGRTGTSSDKYHVSMAYSKDNWASAPLVGSEIGPSDRLDNLYLDEAAPYLCQFRSGETVLSTGKEKVFTLRVGNATANKFGEALQVFESPGVWGSLAVDGTHTLLGAFNYRANPTGELYGIQIAKFVLNHRVNAYSFTPPMTGDSESWKGVDDALFIGSACQAQTTFRFAFDDDFLYCLVERRDDNLTPTDAFDLMFQSGNGSGSPLVLKFTYDSDKKSLKCSNSGVVFKASPQGTYDDSPNDDGIVTEVKIPRKLLNPVNSKLLFNAVTYDEDGKDTFTGLTADNYSLWLPVVLAASVEPKPLPQDGNYEGASWSEDDNQVNPW